MAISVSPLSTTASESSTPDPPAPVMMITFSPLGVGRTGIARANSSRSRKLRARMTPHLLEHVLVDLVVAGQRAGMRAGRPRPHGGAAGLEHDDRLLLRDAFGHFGKRASVLQVFAMLGNDLRVVVLLEEGEQIILVEVALVAKTDDR